MTGFPATIYSAKCDNCGTLMLGPYSIIAHKRFHSKECYDSAQVLHEERRKVCMTCGDLLKRRTNEARLSFENRRTCGGQCANALRGSERKKVPSRVCVICAKAFDRRRNEPIVTFNERKTCGNKRCRLLCAGMTKTGTVAVDILSKRCPSCGNVFYPDPGEMPSRFRGRKACNNRCARKLAGHRRQRPVELFGVEMSRREVAQMYGVSLGTVSTWVRSGRLQLLERDRP